MGIRHGAYIYISVEVIPDELSANQRILDLNTRLRVEKPKGKELVRLYKEIAEAERIAFSEIPRSRLARNVTPLTQRIQNAVHEIFHR